MALEELTHDIRRLLLRVDEPADFSFVPGQYVDVWIPGSDARRSFSMANMPGDGRIELIVKRYPGGRFSSLLDGALSIGDELRFTGPYGALHLRAGDGPVLMVAGGSGMAPVLSLLRQLAAQRSEREVLLLRRARRPRPLLPGSDRGARRTPVPISLRAGPVPRGARARLVHEAVGEHLASGALPEPDVYMCGPPPMVDAAGELLTARHGVDEAHLLRQVHGLRGRGGGRRPDAGLRRDGRHTTR